MHVLAATRNDMLRQIDVILLSLSDESLNAVLALACRMRRLEGLVGPE